MKKHREFAVRELLRVSPDGLTIEAISQQLDANRVHVWRILKRMPDAFIDRWVSTGKSGGTYAAIWSVVIPPPHCPRPEPTRNRPALKRGRPRKNEM